MKVGDLVRCIEFGDVGLIIEIDDIHGINCPYCILYEGKLEWHRSDYIDYECEVVSGCE